MKKIGIGLLVLAGVLPVFVLGIICLGSGIVFAILTFGVPDPLRLFKGRNE